MVAPMAMHGLAHPDRELATAHAAKEAGIPFVSARDLLSPTSYYGLIDPPSACGPSSGFEL